MGTITIERVTAPTSDVELLVGELDAELAAEYPPEQRHGLSVAAIFQPHVRFFVARGDGAALGCGAIALFDGFVEVKRMYVRAQARGGGVAGAILTRLEDEARGAGYSIVRLETGTRQFAAMRFYERAGFRRCDAFGAYATMDPSRVVTSLFYEKAI
jgi:putative acetyltransferase